MKARHLLLCDLVILSTNTITEPYKLVLKMDKAVDRIVEMYDRWKPDYFSYRTKVILISDTKME